MQETVVAWYKRLIADDLFVLPSLKDACIFLATEAGEVLDAVIRLDPAGYKRNNTKNVAEHDLAVELADVVIMAFISAEVLGVDLERTINAKLVSMEKKKREAARNDRS